MKNENNIYCPECGMPLREERRDNTDCRMSKWWEELVAVCPVCKYEEIHDKTESHDIAYNESGGGYSGE